MPMVYTHHIDPVTRIGVWHLSENESFFLGKVSLEKEITHPHKRLQHLAGRFLLTELFEDFPLQLIRISATRKPFIQDDPFHFSISHCGDYAAAIVSRGSRVGVDIEVPQDKIGRISHKFINDAEKNIFTEHITIQDHLTIIWSIKEAVFKWHGAGKVDFRKHIFIKQLKLHENMFQASVEFSADGKKTLLTATGLQINGNWLSWVVTNQMLKG